MQLWYFSSLGTSVAIIISLGDEQIGAMFIMKIMECQHLKRGTIK